MRYSVEHSEETRTRILEASGRQFRLYGYGGVGIDALAKAAGVTSGALYKHFSSKAAVFLAVGVRGMKRLQDGILRLKDAHPSSWTRSFVQHYLGKPHREDVMDGCVLPGLTVDIRRSEPDAREAYQTELCNVAELLATGLREESRSAAWPLLAQLIGGVLLARAVPDAALSDEIAQSVLADLERRLPG